MGKGLVRSWFGPPLVVQILALLVGALVVAQLVTLFLTLVLPPVPPQRYEMADIAATLAGKPVGEDARPLDRKIQSGPPDLSGRGWLMSARSRTNLATLLHVPEERVAIGFYTQLPVGSLSLAPATGGAGTPDNADATPETLSANRPFSAMAALVLHPIDALVPAAHAQTGPGGPGGPGGGMPGGGFPGGGFPGGGFPGGGFPGGSFPGSRIPQSHPPRDSQRSTPDRAPRTEQRDRDGQRQQQSERVPDRNDRIDTRTQMPPEPEQHPQQDGRQGPLLTPIMPRAPGPIIMTGPILTVPPVSTEPARTERPERRARTVPEVARTPDSEPQGVASSAPTPAPSAVATLPAVPLAQPNATTRPAPRVAGDAPVSDVPLPLPQRATGLFGIAPVPFVEGDFVAAVKMADGRWAVVSPKAEGFPNAWQRRVLAWFLLSLLLVAPIAWAFARRIVRPLRRFAQAAEMLGRDPAAAILTLDGPAEVGRAAHAFNQMQSRLRGFVDDRTAMVGAISHDLRTPLTRLRFRIEDVPEEQHAGLLAEIVEMEAMISSVIEYIRDASTPNARERLDLAELVGEVVEDVVMTGGDAQTVVAERAPVDVDALGMRRVLDNLLANAVKYGGRARVLLHVEDSCAIADIVDDGPGIPEDEIERVFEPFYRSVAARASDREGSGLGLAVCRSIARSHGGDVILFRSDSGFTARISVPLAYEPERQVA